MNIAEIIETNHDKTVELVQSYESQIYLLKKRNNKLAEGIDKANKMVLKVETQKEETMRYCVVEKDDIRKLVADYVQNQGKFFMPSPERFTEFVEKLIKLCNA